MNNGAILTTAFWRACLDINRTDSKPKLISAAGVKSSKAVMKLDMKISVTTALQIAVRIASAPLKEIFLVAIFNIFSVKP